MPVLGIDKTEDPCPGCQPGGVCRTPACGRLKYPLDHPIRTGIRETSFTPKEDLFFVGNKTFSAIFTDRESADKFISQFSPTSGLTITHTVALGKPIYTRDETPTKNVTREEDQILRNAIVKSAKVVSEGYLALTDDELSECAMFNQYWIVENLANGVLATEYVENIREIQKATIATFIEKNKKND